jgi:hypothetical protein
VEVLVPQEQAIEEEGEEVLPAALQMVMQEVLLQQGLPLQVVVREVQVQHQLAQMVLLGQRLVVVVVAG